MSSLASKIESLSSSSSPPLPPPPPSTHLCWTLSLVNPFDNETKKIVGCRCSGLKYIEKKKLTQMIADHIVGKGQLCLEGKDNKVYFDRSGDIMLIKGENFVPVVNVFRKPANIYEKIKICLCVSCQTMPSGCNKSGYDIGGILSSGWLGLLFYINTTV